MKTNYMEVMTSDIDITLVNYFKLLWSVLKDGGMKVWVATIAMHVTRIVIVNAIMVYFGNYSFIEAFSYSIVLCLVVIPFEFILAWGFSMFIKKHCMCKLSDM